MHIIPWAYVKHRGLVDFNDQTSSYNTSVWRHLYVYSTQATSNTVKDKVFNIRRAVNVLIIWQLDWYGWFVVCAELYFLSVSGRPRLDILNYMTLSNQCCISPFPMVINLYSTTASFSPRYSIITGSVCVRFGPAICHTLAACVRTWLQYSTSKPKYQIVVTPYVICNNTCLSVR